MPRARLSCMASIASVVPQALPLVPQPALQIYRWIADCIHLLLLTTRPRPTTPMTPRPTRPTRPPRTQPKAPSPWDPSSPILFSRTISAVDAHCPIALQPAQTPPHRIHVMSRELDSQPLRILHRLQTSCGCYQRRRGCRRKRRLLRCDATRGTGVAGQSRRGCSSACATNSRYVGGGKPSSKKFTSLDSTTTDLLGSHTL
jgi:hypothetical protein